MEGYLSGTLSDTELKEFLKLVNKDDHLLKAIIEECLRQESFKDLADDERAEIVYRQIIENKGSRILLGKEMAKLVSMPKFNWKRIIVAASILSFLIYGTWLQLNPRQVELSHLSVVKALTRDVGPGSSKAILALADGQQIILDSVKGNILQQGKLKVTNLNGKLDYVGKSNAVEYHTLSTPMGGTYKLVLPDGTDVWLNAASSITFPTAFVGKERKVIIKGEAYFEVAHNVKQPFHVKVNDVDVEVLGTHFNINGYSDERYVKTTLLEGSVKINKLGKTVLLKSGEQGRASKLTDESIIITTPDINEVMAWKNGRFYYDNADLKTIMRQVMRWYDVEVEYKDNVPIRYFTADISRNNKLSAILKILELSNIRFKLEEDPSRRHTGKIIVLP